MIDTARLREMALDLTTKAYAWIEVSPLDATGRARAKESAREAYAALLDAVDEHDRLRTEKTSLSKGLADAFVEVERLRGELDAALAPSRELHLKLAEAAHTAIDGEVQQLEADNARLQSERDDARTQHATACVDRDDARADNARLQAEVERLRGVLVQIVGEETEHQDGKSPLAKMEADLARWKERAEAAERERDAAVRHRGETNEEIKRLHAVIKSKGFSVEDSVALHEIRADRDRLQAEVERLRDDLGVWQEVAEGKIDGDSIIKRALDTEREKHAATATDRDEWRAQHDNAVTCWREEVGRFAADLARMKERAEAAERDRDLVSGACDHLRDALAMLYREAGLDWRDGVRSDAALDALEFARRTLAAVKPSKTATDLAAAQRRIEAAEREWRETLVDEQNQHNETRADLAAAHRRIEALEKALNYLRDYLLDQDFLHGFTQISRANMLAAVQEGLDAALAASEGTENP